MYKSIKNNILSIPVFGILYLFTSVIVILSIISAHLNLRKILFAVVFFWSETVFLLMGKKLKIIGREHLEKNKKYIILANHGSLFDITAMMAFYPGVAWFGKEYLLKVPVFGHVLKMTGYIPMKTANVKNTKEMLNQLVQKSSGSSIGMFPEGTRTLDGQIHKFHKGFIYLMRSSGLDLLPVTLNGLYDLKPKTRFAINFSAKVEVVIHPPIKNEDIANKDENEIIEIVRNTIVSAYKVKN